MIIAEALGFWLLAGVVLFGLRRLGSGNRSRWTRVVAQSEKRIG